MQAKCSLREWGSSCRSWPASPRIPSSSISFAFPAPDWPAAGMHPLPAISHLFAGRLPLTVRAQDACASGEQCWELAFSGAWLLTNDPWIHRNRNSPTVLYLMQSPLGVTSTRLSQSSLHGPLPDSLSLILHSLVCVRACVHTSILCKISIPNLLIYSFTICMQQLLDHIYFLSFRIIYLFSRLISVLCQFYTNRKICGRGSSFLMQFFFNHSDLDVFLA